MLVNTAGQTMCSRCVHLPKIYEVLKCEICDNPFVPERKDQSCCSSKHAALARKRRSRASRPEGIFRADVLKEYGERCMLCPKGSPAPEKVLVVSLDKTKRVETALVLCGHHAYREQGAYAYCRWRIRERPRSNPELYEELEPLKRDGLHMEEELLDPRLRGNIRCADCGEYSWEIENDKLTFGAPAYYKGRQYELIEGTSAATCPRCLGLDKCVLRVGRIEEKPIVIKRATVVPVRSRDESPLPHPWHEAYEWAAIVDNNGITVAAICIEVEQAAAA